MKIALVHDYLVQYGGAGRVLECFMDLFPHAPIYTLVYDKEATHGRFAHRDIRVSFLQKFPFAKSRHRVFPLLISLTDIRLDSWEANQCPLCQANVPVNTQYGKGGDFLKLKS